MSREVAFFAECLLALIASEWFLTGMSPQVHSQVVFHTELLVTLAARERFLACVDPIMSFQPTTSGAHFLANITLKAISASSVKAPQMELEGGFR